ncbi:MAG: steroid delta-isomerase [Cocleimonas sp.]|jgi:steroid delta-isomerase
MTREENYIHFFTHLTLDDLDKIDDIFTADARFKDPFNDVTGHEPIKTVFRHMYASTSDPKFVVNRHAINNAVLFLEWKFTFNKSNKNWNIDGSSVVSFNDDDLVEEHLDYWDPAEEIYSKIGFIKPIMNFLKSRLTAQ